MSETDLRPETTTSGLMKEALAEAQTLVRLEVALAREEARREMLDAVHSAVAFGVAAMCATLALAMLLVALVLAIFPGPVPALIIASVLLIPAGVAGFFGYRKIPRKPLDQTRRRLESDVTVMKERIA